MGVERVRKEEVKMITWTKVESVNGATTKTENAEVTHVGLVLRTYWRTDQVMSDIWEDHKYAEVWNPEKGQPETVGLDYRSGKDWDTHYYATEEVVDATPETLAAYKAYEDARLAQEKAAREQDARERAEAEALEPRAGRWVKVVRGRKVPQGLQGLCFWRGETKYGERVGVQVGDEQNEVVWTAVSNVEAMAR